MMTLKTNKNLAVPILIMIGMFSVLGFAVGIDAFFIPFVKKAFQISTTLSYLVMTATFGSFVIFSIPSGKLIKKTGYKGGMVIAFVFLALSFYLIGFASKIFSFPCFLAALFVNGMGRVMLNAAVNPYITILGPKESAAKRICIMGISNKISYALASLILALFLNLSDVHMEDTIIPFYIISIIILAIGIGSYFAPLPDVKAEGEETDKNQVLSKNLIVSNSKTNLLQFPHLILGTGAYFFYTGVEVIALGTITHYAVELGLSSPQNYVWLTSIAMILGYMLGVILIPKVISQVTALKISAILGLCLSLAIILASTKVSIFIVALLGLSNAMILPAIWPLSLADLGKFTKSGSGFLVMGGIGGALIPLLFGFLADTISSSQLAYIVCIPSYLFILFFGIRGYKIRTQ